MQRETALLPGRKMRRRRRRADLGTIAFRRCVLAVPIVGGVSLLVFLLAGISPFDPLAAYQIGRASCRERVL